MLLFLYLLETQNSSEINGNKIYIHCNFQPKLHQKNAEVKEMVVYVSLWFIAAEETEDEETEKEEEDEETGLAHIGLFTQNPTTPEVGMAPSREPLQPSVEEEREDGEHELKGEKTPALNYYNTEQISDQT